MWRAHITDAGQFYLDYGYHPDHPDRLLGGATPPRQRARATRATSRGATSQRRAQTSANSATGQPAQQAAAATVERARELIERLQREGGTVRIESPDADARALYRRVIHAAKQHQIVPAGFHLRHTGRASGDLVIRLSNDENPDETDWNRIRLNTRRITTDPALVFVAIEKDPAGLDVTEASVPRALELIRSLATEARHRGHRVGVNTKTKHPSVYLQVGTTRRSVKLYEEYDEVPHVLTAEELRQQRRESWRTFPKVDKVPSGRLRLEIARAGWDKHDSWADDKRTPLEKRLPRVIRDVETGIAADEEARLAAQRAAEEQRAAWARQEEEKRLRWQAALAEARAPAVETLRKKTFRSAYDAWSAANEIRAFCNALEHSTASNGSQDDSANLTRWIAWARAAADRIDPTHGESALANIDFDIEPTPDDLRPYLGEWSPHEPRHEYGWERDEKRIAAVHLEADTWHHGMRGRATWWRK